MVSDQNKPGVSPRNTHEPEGQRLNSTLYDTKKINTAGPLASTNSQERATMKTISVKPHEEMDEIAIEVKPDCKIVNELLNTDRNQSSKDDGTTSRHKLTS